MRSAQCWVYSEYVFEPFVLFKLALLQSIVNKIADDCIRTGNLWCWKLLLYRQRHNHSLKLHYQWGYPGHVSELLQSVWAFKNTPEVLLTYNCRLFTYGLYLRVVLERTLLVHFHGKIFELLARSHYLYFVSSRGGLTQQTWKPQVTPVGEMPTKPTQPGQVFTKTSLAATPQVRHSKRFTVRY